MLLKRTGTQTRSISGGERVGALLFVIATEVACTYLLHILHLHSDFDPNFLWKGALFTETGTFGDGFVFSVDGTTAAAGEIQLFKSPRYVDVSNIKLDSYGALYVGGGLTFV